jgi:hypothetical protein
MYHIDRVMPIEDLIEHRQSIVEDIHNQFPHDLILIVDKHLQEM